MSKNKLILHSFLNSLGVFVYISVVALIIYNSEHIFGKMQNYWGPVGFLLLFVVSAAIVGMLTFGQPVYLYLEGFKNEAFRLAIYTISWILIYTVIVLAIVALFS